jgi:hypothetical protein
MLVEDVSRGSLRLGPLLSSTDLASMIPVLMGTGAPFNCDVEAGKRIRARTDKFMRMKRGEINQKARVRVHCNYSQSSRAMSWGCVSSFPGRLDDVDLGLR